MVNKKFISTDSMKETLLEKLIEKFNNTSHFNTDSISINLSLTDVVNERAKDITEPSIYVIDTAWLKIQELVQTCTGEVAWHCLVEQHPDNKYVIYDVLVFPQEVSAATADGIDGEYEMWLATLPDEQFDFMRCHMHSHVNMGVTPSSVDENYYANLMTHVTDYYITVVINKSGSTHVRLYDVVNNLVWSDLTLQVCDKNGVTFKAWYNSIKSNIKTRATTYSGTSVSTYKPITNNNKYNDADSYYKDYYNSKKKETKQVQTQTTSIVNTSETQRRGGKNSTKILSLTGPDNIEYCYFNNNEVVAHIYRHYEKSIKDYTAFTRNKIMELVKARIEFAIEPVTLEMYSHIDNTMEDLTYAVNNCDIWVVTEEELD